MEIYNLFLYSSHSLGSFSPPLPSHTFHLLPHMLSITGFIPFYSYCLEHLSLHCCSLNFLLLILPAPLTSSHLFIHGPHQLYTVQRSDSEMPHPFLLIVFTCIYLNILYLFTNTKSIMLITSVSSSHLATLVYFDTYILRMCKILSAQKSSSPKT